jgi:hypothetical protein
MDEYRTAASGNARPPAIVGPDAAHRKVGHRPRRPIGAPPQTHKLEPAARRCSVTFVLIGANPRAAERDRKGYSACHQDTLRASAGSSVHAKVA